MRAHAEALEASLRLRTAELAEETEQRAGAERAREAAEEEARARQRESFDLTERLSRMQEQADAAVRSAAADAVGLALPEGAAPEAPFEPAWLQDVSTLLLKSGRWVSRAALRRHPTPPSTPQRPSQASHPAPAPLPALPPLPPPRRRPWRSSRSPR